MSQLSFTIFTPVYNRVNKIHRVWESLNSQTYKNFEWIIVNDGSTDKIEELLDEYVNKASFPVKVIHFKMNRGKHFAWNEAVELASGELFIPADSDDSFTEYTLERFYKLWIGIAEPDRKSFSGINVLCINPQTQLIEGNPYPRSPMISNNLELRYKYKIRGEKWGTIRTDLLKVYKFPEISTSRGSFIMNYLWFQLASKYNVLCVNEALRYYFQDTTRRVTDLQLKKIKGSAEVFYFYWSWHLDTNMDYILKYENRIRLVKQFLNLWRTGILTNRSVKKIFSDFTNKHAKRLLCITMIPGVILYRLTYSKLNKV
jgi:glycosyltransferase involved in cell wall biosynthesis